MLGSQRQVQPLACAAAWASGRLGQGSAAKQPTRLFTLDPLACACAAKISGERAWVQVEAITSRSLLCTRHDPQKGPYDTKRDAQKGLHCRCRACKEVSACLKVVICGALHEKLLLAGQRMHVPCAMGVHCNSCGLQGSMAQS